MKCPLSDPACRRRRTRNYIILTAIAVVIALFIFGRDAFTRPQWTGDPDTIVQISAGPNGYLTRTNSGAVTYTGPNLYHEGDVRDWNDAIDISAGDNLSACVTSSGRVLLAGSFDDQILPTGFDPDMEIRVLRWRNVVQVVAGKYEVYGLMSDGTVRVASLGNYMSLPVYVSAMSHITRIQAAGSFLYGLREDGVVLIPGRDGPDPLWTDIVDIDVSNETILGVKEDGTVVYRNWANESIGGWKDVYANLQNWTDIVALAVEPGITAGLKSDGTVILEEAPEGVRREVASWTDVVAISAGDDYLIWLTSDGTVLSTAPFEGIEP